MYDERLSQLLKNMAKPVLEVLRKYPSLGDRADVVVYDYDPYYIFFDAMIAVKVHHKSVHLKTINPGIRDKNAWYISGTRIPSGISDAINEAYGKFILKKVSSSSS